jgi:hypothetical protein
MSGLKAALLGTALLAAAGGVALAQAPTYDPDQLPAIQGKVAQYTLTPRGDVDGLILDDGTQVHVPPHLSTQLVFAVHPGDTVTIHGLKARALPMVMAMSVTNDATHVSVAGGGPRPFHDGAQQEVTGKIKAQLHGPRGELNGVLLEDGTEVNLPPPEAERMSAQLAVGQTIYARGGGVANALGHVVMARAIGATKESATEFRGPRPGWDHWTHGMMGDGPRGEAGPPPGGPGAPPPPPRP